MYQRLGLEDDIVDPSNTLLREGPVLKISFRRRDPVERYLFLVGGGGPRPEGSPGRTARSWLPGPPSAAGGTGRACLRPPLLWHRLTWTGAGSRPQGFPSEGVPRRALGSES